jgi:hypothetical protein
MLMLTHVYFSLIGCVQRHGSRCRRDNLLGPCPACAGCVCDGDSDSLSQGLRISLRRPQPCPDVVAGASLGRRVGRRLCCVARTLCCLRCSLAKGVRVGARAARPDGFDYVELRGSGSSTRRRRVGLLPTSQPVPPAGGPVSLTSHSSNSSDAAGGGSTAEQQPPEFLSLFSFVLCGYRLLSLVRVLTSMLCVCLSHEAHVERHEMNLNQVECSLRGHAQRCLSVALVRADGSLVVRRLLPHVTMCTTAASAWCCGYSWRPLAWGWLWASPLFLLSTGRS